MVFAIITAIYHLRTIYIHIYIKQGGWQINIPVYSLLSHTFYPYFRYLVSDLFYQCLFFPYKFLRISRLHLSKDLSRSMKAINTFISNPFSIINLKHKIASSIPFLSRNRINIYFIFFRSCYSFCRNKITLLLFSTSVELETDLAFCVLFTFKRSVLYPIILLPKLKSVDSSDFPYRYFFYQFAYFSCCVFIRGF